MILDEAPYVDAAGARQRPARSVDAYVEHAVAEGYNAIAIPGFLEYVTFAEVGDGHDVYADDDARRARRGDAGGVRPDLAVRPRPRPEGLPAHRHARADDAAGGLPRPTEFGLDTEDPELWDVYAAGLDELYREMPYLEGVLLRIGEAGTVYNLDGWDYYSDLAVTIGRRPCGRCSTAFTDAGRARRPHRHLPDLERRASARSATCTPTRTSYHEVLDGIDSDHLVVSTKYTLGDFYSHLPLNDTLETGDQRRIVEFQSRREFEAYGALPNDLGVLYRAGAPTLPRRRTRASRASGPGPRTVARGAPAR